MSRSIRDADSSVTYAARRNPKDRSSAAASDRVVALAVGPASRLTPAALLQLQRLAGNAGVGMLLGREAGDRSVQESAGRRWGSSPWTAQISVQCQFEGTDDAENATDDGSPGPTELAAKGTFNVHVVDSAGNPIGGPDTGGVVELYKPGGSHPMSLGIDRDGNATYELPEGDYGPMVVKMNCYETITIPKIHVSGNTDTSQMIVMKYICDVPVA